MKTYELDAQTPNGAVKVQCEDYSVEIGYRQPNEAQIRLAKEKCSWLFQKDKTCQNI